MDCGTLQSWQLTELIFCENSSPLLFDSKQKDEGICINNAIKKKSVKAFANSSNGIGTINYQRPKSKGSVTVTFLLNFLFFLTFSDP
jgi:hypothetical protein